MDQKQTAYRTPQPKPPAKPTVGKYVYTKGTLKQRATLAQLQAKPSLSLYQAMRRAGYAHYTAKQPEKNLLEQPGFIQLLEEAGITDHKIAETLYDGLHATTRKPHLIDRDDKGRPIYDYVPEDDFPTRHRYLETALRVKGHTNSELAVQGNVYQMYIQNNQINPNDVQPRKLVESTLKVLMEQTRRIGSAEVPSDKN